MTTVSCPKCGDSVLMPDGASAQATVRCPLCQEVFALAEILSSMPPTLIVVDDPGAAKSVATPAAGAEQFEGMPSIGLDDSETPASAPAFSIATEAVSPGGAGTAAAARRRVPARRPRKKTSPVMEVVKIVLGGIAGLVIAQAILWWMPWTKYRKDPFKLGPKVSQFAPWIVPDKFRGTAAPSTASEDAGGHTDATGAEAFAPAPSKQFETSESGLPQRTFVDPSKPADDPTGSKGKSGRSQKATGGAKKQGAGGARNLADLVAEDEEPALKLDEEPAPGALGDPLDDMAETMELMKDIETDPGATAEGPVEETPKEETLAEDMPAEDMPKEEDVPDAKPAPAAKLQVQNAPQVTVADLRTAADEAKTAVEAWTAAEDPNSREVLAPSYRALSKLGEAVTFATEATEEDRQSASELLKTVAADNGRVKALGRAASQWLGLEASKRPSAGVLVAGKVKSVEQKGEFSVTEVEIADDSPAVQVVARADPKDAYQVGSDVLILGAIVQDPTTNLEGFEGDAKSVVVQAVSQAAIGNANP